MLTNRRLQSIAAVVLERLSQYALTGEGLFAYRCVNDVQNVARIVVHVDDVEVQLNEIRHASGPHYHDTDMTSVLLAGGYTWYLRQSGASQALELHASQGSIIRMGPKDEHWIPLINAAVLPVSLCVFEKQTDWHLHFPRLPDVEIGLIIGRAIRSLHEIACEG